MSTGALDSKAFNEFVVKEVKPYNHDSSVFVIEIPDNVKPGIRVASAVLLAGAGDGIKDKDGKPVMRPYTPVTTPEDVGHIDFLIKKYSNGPMSSHIHTLKPGDKLGIKGPMDTFAYKPNSYESIVCIAGGTGVTPMWQLMQAIEADKTDKTRVILIYANKTEKDILLREEFDRMVNGDSRFKIIYGVDQKSSIVSNAVSFEGYITKQVLQRYLPGPESGEKLKIFVCGPPAQVEAVSGAKAGWSQGDLKGLLADLGYQTSQVHKF